MEKKRSIALGVVLSILTCGLYTLYWMVCLQNDVNDLTDDHSMSGGMVLLLSIVTCGIYTFVWAYQMGKRIDKLNGQTRGSDSSILFLLVCFLSSIVLCPIIQSNVNEFYEN